MDLRLFINSIKFRWLLATGAIGFCRNLIEGIISKYLGHKKIIHYRDGCPVYSLTIPALLSKPSVNLISNLSFKLINNRRFPIMMSLAVTDKCNANCRFCSFSPRENADQPILSLEQYRKVIKESQGLGVAVINLVGGEPLESKEITEIIKAVDKTRSVVNLYTNGWRLEDKAKLLKRAGLDGVFVSLDSSVEKEHDKIRAKEGLFKKALAGIKEAKRAGMSVGISTCIDENNFRRGKLGKVIDLGKTLGVHEVLILDALPAGRLKNCRELAENRWTAELIENVKKYNNDSNYPGVLVYAYTISRASLGCAGGKTYFYVSPYGDVTLCDFDENSRGHVLKQSLAQIWDRLANPPDTQGTDNCKVRTRLK
jgi:MoaA/NifB/PqqE/SkfB family radical SAM enzyme